MKVNLVVADPERTDKTICLADILQVEEHKLPTSYWYMIEYAYGASGNFKNRERLKTRSGKVVKKWNDERFKYLTLEFDE